MATNTMCKHGGCRCALTPDRAAQGKQFCSDYCEVHARQDATGTTHACKCGHASCTAATHTAPAR